MEKGQLASDPQLALQAISRRMLADGLDVLADLNKSHGSHLYDSKRETHFLDFFGCFATISLGYMHPRLTSKESLEELGWAAVQKPSNSDLYSWRMAEFVDTFSRIAAPDFMTHMFFIEGGALAVENALKTSFDWKVRKNLAAGKPEQGYKVIHFKEAFHGRSGYTLSLTNTADPRKTQYFPKFNWPRITNPKCTFPLDEAGLARVKQLEDQALAEIEAVLAKEGDDVACLILEPVQAEGGDHHFRLEFHRALRRLCSDHDILFIYDEVQTGFGSSGRMWAFEHFVEPDIISFGKKSQVCGILASKRVDEVPENVFKVSSRINSTWGGNLVDMVRCRMHLEIYKEDRVIEHAARMGTILLRELQQLQAEFPSLLSNARGLGLLCAVDLPDAEFRNELRRQLFERKLIILGCGERSLRFRTALTIPEEDLLKGIAIIRETLSSMS